MNKTIFFDSADIAIIKQGIKEKTINISDIDLLVSAELQRIYNTLVHSLYNNLIISTLYEATEENIIYLSCIEKMLDIYNIPFWKFHKLLEAGYIGRCGSGYIFTSPLMSLTDEQNNRLEFLNFNLGIMTI